VLYVLLVSEYDWTSDEALSYEKSSRSNVGVYRSQRVLFYDLMSA
jgi:hypothetical protein